MKKNLLLIVISICLLTACKKGGNTEVTPGKIPVLLLKKVIINTASDPFKGSTVAEFSYNGKQLNKAMIYNYGFSVDVDTLKFTYDANQHLSSVVTVNNSYSSDNSKSVVTYSGDNISEIKTYNPDNFLLSSVSISYQNGRISEWAESNRYKVTYTYDSDGNNVQQVFTDFQNLIPGGIATVYNYQGFDNKPSINSATPLWIYFRSRENLLFLNFANSKYNAVKLDNETYKYVYNDKGYPAQITWDDPKVPFTQSYKYEYIEVN